MVDIGKTKIARLTKPQGGFLGGRYIPKERINHNTWAQLLRLEKPPADGPYILKSHVDPAAVKKTAKDVRKTLEVNELLALLKAAAANKKLSRKRPEKPVLGGPPRVTDWNDISPDQESDYLGIEQLKEGQSVGIIGAGISGLCTAYLLNKARPDLQISIFDSKPEVGGWMHTTITDAALFESGPRTLLPSHPGTAVLLHILHQLGALDQLTGVPQNSATNTKGLVYDGKLVQLPSSLGETASFLQSPLLKGLKWPLLRELWRKARPHNHQEESVGEFVSRRFDSKFNDRIISALMRGIYGADSNLLSARSVARFKRMYYLERTEELGILMGALSGSLGYLDSYTRRVIPKLTESIVVPERKANDKVDLGFNPSKFSLFGFKDGIQSLARILAASLEKTRNVKFYLGTPVASIEPGTQSVAFKTEAESHVFDMALVNSFSPSMTPDANLQKLLASVNYSSLAVVNITTPEPITKDWFGVLVPKSEDSTNPESILGIIFDSSVRNSSVQVLGNEPLPKVQPNLTVMLGGDLWTDMTEPEATQRALDGVERILGPFDRSKVTTQATLQRNCIPQYRVGHSALSQKVHEDISKLYRGRLVLSGMAFGRGVGVSDCILDSLMFATRFSTQRQLLHPEFFFNEIWSVTRPDWYA